MKISFHSHANRTNFHMKSLALSLAFVMRFKSKTEMPYMWFALPPCWWTKQQKICSLSMHKNGSELPEEKNLIVQVHQHGRHDVTCKPSIAACGCVYIPCVPCYVCVPTNRVNRINLPVVIISTKKQRIEERQNDSLLVKLVKHMSHGILKRFFASLLGIHQLSQFLFNLCSPVSLESFLL